MGAPDAHAKNYGVMLAGEEVRLAPLYDVASGSPYDSSTQTGLKFAAMRIGKESQFGKTEPRYWRRFAAETGLDEDALCVRVYELATILPDAVSEAIRAETPVANVLGQRLLDKFGWMCELARSQYRNYGTNSAAATPMRALEVFALRLMVGPSPEARNRLWHDKSVDWRCHGTRVHYLA